MTRQNLFARALFILLGVALGSCSPKQFSVESKTKSETPVDPPPGPSPQGIIQCAPAMNGGQTSITIAANGTNPTVAANCNPSTVTYGWTVTRNGAAVTVNGLTGATSTPNFTGAGPGTYSIRLTATANGWTTFTLSQPLTVVVQQNTNLPDITCSPTINSGLTSITLTNTNPTVHANCTPSAVAYVWTVKNGGVVTVPGLTGATSTPNFLSMPSGTYQVFLSANASGYDAFTAITPLVVTVPQKNTGTNITETKTISLQNNKLDILLVVDDSKSMLKDNQRLATRLQSFVSDLTTAGFDWQMCLTLTRPMKVSSTDPNYYWGASYNWYGHTGSPQWVLKNGTANLWQIFENTINYIGAGWAGTDDERTIKAAWWHLWNGEPDVQGASGCYRKDAGLAVLILSDEDERSIGGDDTQAFYVSEKGKPLENDDLPQTYVNRVKTVFGNNKRFTVNSIIVQPGDNQCLAAQDAEGSKAHYGINYAELSDLTQGYKGSICATDYANHLAYFKDAIVRSQASIPLQCAPVGGVVTVGVTPNYTYTSSVSGTNLVFSPQIPAGSTVNLQYKCP